MIKKTLKILKGIVWTVILLFLVLIATTFIPIKGNYKVFTVQSGSMEPAVKLGSLIFVYPRPNYKAGDIVTRKTSDPKLTVTHRIIAVAEENGGIVYATKGDANNAEDPEKASPSDIIGKMIWKLPLVGYPIGYARSTTGFIILVIIPAVIIVYEEIRKIKEEMAGIFRKKKREKKMPKEEYSFEEKYIRPPKADNVRRISFGTEKDVVVDKKTTGRKMDL